MSSIPDEVVNMVQYLLIADYQKLPFKRTDIIKTALGNTKPSSHPLFESALNLLHAVFGLRAVEIKDKSSYILVSSIKDGIKWRPEIDNPLNTGYGILIAVLATIFMSQESLIEDDLWKFLELLQLKQESKIPYNNREYKLKDLVNLWIRQLYLKRENMSSHGKESFVFTWGLRAENEINRKDLLEWFCRIFGDGCTPESWKSQFLSASEHDRNFQESC